MPESFAPLPFDEAIEFFKAKVRIPTRKWDDLWKEQHARGFMSAGAMRDDMLADMQGAILKALEKGSSLAEFRKTFDDVVARTGWSYHGARGWRSALIYNTNLTSSYAAGRWKQLTDPATLKLRPYLMYRHGGSIDPRPEHLAWDGLVLPADDPWWQSHYPPNGWGCSCYVVSVSKRDLKGMGKDGPDTAPSMTPQTIHGRHVADRGIDPGWDYNVGEAAFGRNETKLLMENRDNWTPLDSWGPAQHSRPEKIPVESTKTKLGDAAGTVEQLRQALRTAIDGDTARYADPTGEIIEVNQGIVDHILEDPDNRWRGREKYFPFIPELIKDPYEIWLTFERNNESGRIRLRRRYAKALRVEANRVIGLVAETQHGKWVSFNFFHGGLSGAGKLRVGRLLYGKAD